jgi:hypothetical protein
MDVKLLLYLIGAALWYFLKYRAEQEKKSKQPIPVPAPVDDPADMKREVRVRKAAVKAPIERSPVSRSPLVSKRSRGDGAAAAPGSLEVMTSDVSSRSSLAKSNIYHESTPELTNGIPEQVQESPAAKFGQELRSGRFDWQRAVIINELIQRRW